MKLKSRNDNGYTTAVPVRAIDQYVLGTTGPCQIPVAKLKPSIRPVSGVNPKHVQRIINNYNPKKFGRLTIGARTWTSAQTLVVLDGNHRYEAAKALGMEMVPCELVEVESPEEESRLIVEMNRERVLYTQLDTFEKERSYNPAAKEIAACLAERGLKTGAKRTATTIPAVAAIRAIYAKGGYVGLARTLDTVLSAWPDDDERFKGEILCGVAEFFQKNSRVEIDQLAHRMAATTPHTLLTKGTQRWLSWRGLGNTGKSKINCVADEIETAYRKRKLTAVA